MPVAVVVPKWGMNMTHAQVTLWLKQPGDAVDADEPLAELETEKLNGDVTAPAAGTVAALLVPEGTQVKVGEALCVLALPGEDPAAVRQEAEAARAAATERAAARTAALSGRRGAGGPDAPGLPGSITPAARRLAREIGIEPEDLAALPGKVGREEVLRLFADRQRTPLSRFAEAAGLTWHYVEAGAGGLPLLCLHGLGGSWKSWFLNLEPLAADRRVIALDLPGCGLSDKPDPAAYGYAAADLSGQVLAFTEVLGLERFAVAGNSLGGAVAIQMALSAPARVAALVLAAPGGLGTEIAPEVIASALAFPDPENTRAALTGLFANPGLVSNALVAESYGLAMLPGAWEACRATVTANTAGGRQHPVLLDQLGQVQAPALVIWGEQDAIIPAAHAGAAAALPVARIHVRANCGHCPQIEAAPAFNELVANFLGGQ